MKTLNSIETGQLIKSYRKAQNLTQFQLAEQAEIDDKQLGKIERGVHYPSVPTFLKIIKTLNINIEEFYSDNSASVPPQESKLMRLIRASSQKELELVYKILEVIRNN